MNYQDKIIKDLAKKHNLDSRIVKAIVYYPIKFTKDVFKDPVDMRPVRIRYFGVFTQKVVKNKMNRLNNMFEILYNNIDDSFIVMNAVLGFPMKNKDSARKILEQARDTNDYDKLKLVWDAYNEYIK